VLEQIRHLGLQEFVTAPGYIEDERLLPTLAAFDAVVLPYDRVPKDHRRHVASLSAAAHDAILAGVPVICSGARAMTDLVIPNVNGLIYTDSAEDTLLDALRRFTNDSCLRDQLRRGARDSADQLARMDMGQVLHDLYRSALRKTTASR
jgi:glycosyltransferase involved in cell wall biosynthesis